MGIGSEPMCIPIICWHDKLPKFEKQGRLNRILIASFREPLSIVSQTFFIISPCCTKFYYSNDLFFTPFETVEESQVAVKCALFLTSSLLIALITGWFCCAGQNYTPEN